MLNKLLFFCLTVCAASQFLQRKNNLDGTARDFIKSDQVVTAVLQNITIDEEQIETFIKDVIECKGSLSAVSVAIVQLNDDDSLQAEYSNAFGSINPVDPEEGDVDEYNNFCIGSCTKQFTAALAGVALEKHGMDYDAKLIDLLRTPLNPEAGKFFNDKGLAQVPTVRDLLSHRMAIPRYDTAWLAGLNGTRLDYWPKLHLLADQDEDYIAKEYRSSLDYNNWMVSLAGYIVELLTNQTWEAQVIEHYFVPLGLHNATFAHVQWYNRSTAALPGYRISNDSDPGSVYWETIMPDFMRETVNKVAPAGSICLSANDMRKYLTFLLNSTSSNVREDRLKRKIEQTMRETSNVLRGLELDPLFSSDAYALGWVKGYYREHEQVWHDGSISGYLSFEAIYPKLKLGIFVSTTNGIMDDDQSEWIVRGLFDLVMGVPTKEGPLTADDICNRINDSLPQADPDSLKPFPGCHDKIDDLYLEPLVGTYRHEVFGDIIIRYDKDEHQRDKKFTFEYGKFFNGILCHKVGDMKFNEFQLYFDPNGPMFFANDPDYNEKFGAQFIFARDKANRGTRILFPGLELQAPELSKQTYYKQDYHACEVPCDNGVGKCSPCKNNGTCVLYGEWDFVCNCKAPTNGTLCEKVPLMDCSDWKKYHPELSETSGVYPVNIPGTQNTAYNVYCDMEDNGGGWTTIQRRLQEEKTTDFNVNFVTYVNGIGRPGENHSYFIGLDALSNLANSADKDYTLRIHLEDCNGRTVMETYQNFWIGDKESSNYTLHIKSGSATGDAGDALTISNSYITHNNMPFTTYDHEGPNQCATQYRSGWWFNDCFAANLNGIYYSNCSSNGATDGVTWTPFHNNKYSLRSAYMEIKRS
jgi:CubicO group peptidase (beta-lactamase class C family)